MIEPTMIWHIARYESKLLFRSWAFRIFSILGLVILVFMNIGIGTTLGGSDHHAISVASALPLANFKLLNVYQGIIAVFLATEFLKRDRKNDTAQVVNTRSFSNASYIIGKLTGILFVFATLNLFVALQVFIIHYFFAPTIFAWLPYFYMPIIVGLPTLIFVIGLSFILIKLIRSQAVVFVIVLTLSLLSLIFIREKLFYIFDLFGMYLPLMYSDFIGFGNLSDLLMVKGAYFLIGISLIALSIIFTDRLRQSTLSNIITVLTAIVGIFSAAGLISVYLDTKYEAESYRNNLINDNETIKDYPAVSIVKSNMDLKHTGEIISVRANLDMVYYNNTPLDSILLTINPGLEVTQIKAGTIDIPFTQKLNQIWIKPNDKIYYSDSMHYQIDYSGQIDERYCYLDIDDERYKSNFSYFMYHTPKRYAIVTDDYLLLTAESGWYLISGLPIGAAFPSPPHIDYTQYSLQVEVPTGQTAISQGTVEFTENEDNTIYHFQSDVPLPKISLTIGKYDKIGVNVDNIDYNLYYLPGHDYFADYLDQITDTIPYLIKELKDQYEVSLGLTYPYKRLQLVETPIQFYSYKRLWTTAQETVQPEIVLLSEMGTICSGTDFERMKRDSKRAQERANQEDKTVDLQSGYFNNFVNFDLLGLLNNPRGIARENVEMTYKIFPNYMTFGCYFSYEPCPVINSAFESYFIDKITASEDNRWHFWRGMTETEDANLALRNQSLAELLDNPKVEPVIKTNAVNNKGRSLLALIETYVGKEKFETKLDRFIQTKRFKSLKDDDIEAFIDSLGDFKFSELVDRWYNDTALPGYIVGDFENYRVLDGERMRSQLKFDISNPTEVDGLIELSVRSRGNRTDFGPWFMRRQNQDNYTQQILLPAMTSKEVGIILDDQPSEVNIDTYVSQNLPSVITWMFREDRDKKNEVPFSGEINDSISNEPVDTGELIVDNEDDGFKIETDIRENWFRNFLLALFNQEDEEETYIGMRIWDPPGSWKATTGEDYYGKFVRSAEYKRSGSGESKVAWIADIEDPGEYDIYYYCLGENMPMPWRRGRGAGGGRPIPKGKKNMLIYHDDGVEEVTVDLGTAEVGWNYLGTFHISEGEARVELTDNTENDIVVADAVKWVKD